MSSNPNDTVMTRFLFAILQQKNLKDVSASAIVLKRGDDQLPCSGG
jgi:hypothetical protein